MTIQEGSPSLNGGITKLRGRTWSVIILIAICGQVAWAVENNFFNLFIQDAFGASLSEVALMVSASALAATLTTVFVGAWSDRIGHRKVFIVAGYILWGCSILVFAVLQDMSRALAGDVATAAQVGVMLTIVFDCVMTFFGSSANDSCFNAWVTDVTDDTNRGRVEGVNSAMPLLAMLLVFGGAMFLMYTGDAGIVTYDYRLFFTIIGGLVIVVGVLTAFLMEDSHPVSARGRSYLRDIVYGFCPTALRENPMLYLVLLAFCIFSTALQVFMPYYVLYLRLPYILSDSYVLVMAPGIVVAAVFTIFYGRIIDRKGFSWAICIPFALFLAGCLVLTLFTGLALVFIGSVLMLSGYLGATACFAAEIRNNTPLDRVGLFQGLRIFMVVLIPMLIGPWIGSAVSASGGSIGFGVVGDGFTPSSSIFLAGALVSLLAIAVLVVIRRRKALAAAEDVSSRCDGRR